MKFLQELYSPGMGVISKKKVFWKVHGLLVYKHITLLLRSYNINDIWLRNFLSVS